LFGALLAAIYGHHIYVMGYIKFDYGYNMKFNVFIGTLSFICGCCGASWNEKRELLSGNVLN